MIRRAAVRRTGGIIVLLSTRREAGQLLGRVDIDVSHFSPSKPVLL
jgi:hypothetical protein